jgi:diguanylate cyclase (GGDEF)-like protein/PAS domain S-box-containing protein
VAGLLISAAERPMIHYVMTETTLVERYQALLASLHDGALVVDADGLVVECAEQAARLLGMKAADLVGRPAAEVLAAVQSDGTPIEPSDCPWEATRRTGNPQRDVDLRLDGPGGPARVSVNTAPVPAGGDGEPPFAVTVAFRDRGETSQLAEELRRADSQFRLLAETSTDLISRHDPEGVWLFASDAARRLLGVEPAELLGRSLYDLLHPDDVEAFALAHAGWLERPTDFAIIYRLRRADGEHLWVETIGRSIADPGNGEMQELHATTRDVTERKQAELQLAERALRDPLTGLANRAALLPRLRDALDRSERLPTTVALLFCDLNRFKQVNDELGHAAGDRLLVTVAERLRTAVRGADLVARLGGDEFVVVCQDVHDADEALAVAARIVEAMRAPLTLAGRQVTPSTSIGVALAAGHTDRVEALLARADQAMYQAKQRGGEVRVQLAP